MPANCGLRPSPSSPTSMAQVRPASLPASRHCKATLVAPPRTVETSLTTMRRMRPDARLCYLGGRKKLVSYVAHLTYIEGANTALLQFIHSHEGIPLSDRINKIL